MGGSGEDRGLGAVAAATWRPRLRELSGRIFGGGAETGTRGGVRSPESGTRPTGPRLQEEKIFQDLVEFFFDEGQQRNMLQSR
jgi:hypothetical protein